MTLHSTLLLPGILCATLFPWSTPVIKSSISSLSTPSFIPPFHIRPPPAFHPNSPPPHMPSYIHPPPSVHPPPSIHLLPSLNLIPHIQPPPSIHPLLHSTLPHPSTPHHAIHRASPIPRPPTSHSTSPIHPTILFPPTSCLRHLIPLKRPMFPSIIQPVGAYRNKHPSPHHPPPSTSPSTVTPAIPTSIVRSPVATSIVVESTVVTNTPPPIASEQDVHPTTPPASHEDQSSPVVEIFSGDIAERLGSWRRTTPSRLATSSMVPERLSSPRTKKSQASSSSKKRKIDFGDAIGSVEGGLSDL